MKIHLLTIEEAIESLGGKPGGLTHAEAQRRLKEYGLNHIEEVARESMLLRFIKEFTHFFALILWVAAGLCFFSEWHDPGQGWSKVGIAIIGVILINGSFAFWQEWRIEKTLAALKNLLPHQVEVLRESSVVLLPVEQLVPGDILLLEAGDNIPADCRLIESYGVRVNNASVTGESLPQAREARECERNGEVLHASNVLLTGTSLVSGQAKAIVFATGARTEFGRIAHLSQIDVEQVSPLKLEMARFEQDHRLSFDRYRHRFLCGRLDVYWYFDLEGIHLCCRHHCGPGAGRLAGDPDSDAGAGNPAHGQTQCPDSLSAVRGNAGLDYGNLH